ncbi:hypothetical protein [Carnobacterium funditum]|uniref:hypothetical protein n=1 Tax=Carnobacterium funditum TaxID=2752 RepID=UPI00068CD081|nr:hypothetical protein [Carnobacterium funditum]
MIAFGAFLKKESLELMRSYKGFLFLALFTFLGILSPVSAVFMPDLIAEFLPANIELVLPEPAALDSWVQFHQNITQIGYVFLVIAWSNTFVKEKGPLVLLVTKGLKRPVVFFSKYIMASAVWTVSYLIGAAITAGYTYYYFADTWETAGLLWGLAGVYLFGLWLLAFLFLGAVLFDSTFGALAWTGGAMAILFFLELFVKLAEWSPLQVVTSFTETYQAGGINTEWKQSAIVLVVSSILFLIGTPLFYKKKEL